MGKNFDNDLLKEVKIYLKAYAEAYCKEGARILTETAKSAIEKFYSDYSPKVYDRTENLLHNSYKKYIKDNGRIMYGGVSINSKAMKEVYENVSANYVLDAGWHGWHGMKLDDYVNNWSFIPNIYPIQTSPSPLKIVEKKRKELENDKDLQNHAGKIAYKKQKYPCMERCGFKG